MAFNKPFRAAPVKVGERYRAEAKRQKTLTVAKVLGGAIAVGLVVGTGSAFLNRDSANAAIDQIKPLAVAVGVARARAPQAGDNWSGCNAARAAGTAPIYEGEPGYREGLDGDGDGIACEPYRGRR